MDRSLFLTLGGGDFTERGTQQYTLTGVVMMPLAGGVEASKL